MDRHVGYLGNVEADSAGKVRVTFTDHQATLGAFDIIGRSLVIHEDEDDLGLTTGNAEARLGCCVIKEDMDGNRMGWAPGKK